MSNKVFIGASVDGYIADRDGQLDFLQSVPNPEKDGLGFHEFIDSIDALLMGRNTYETVLGFGGAWPYTKPVFVLSNSLVFLPEHVQGKVELLSGPIQEVVEQLNNKGFERLYIDGGKLIQSFLQEEMIDEIIISQVPMLLGGGVPLFDLLPRHIELEHIATKVLLNAIVQTHYKCIKNSARDE